MNRNARMIVVVAIAVLTAALASFGVYEGVRRIPPVKVETPSAFVVVAAKPLEMGIRLTKDDVKVIPWPARNPIEGSFSKVEQVVDRGLTASVVANEPISEGRLAPKAAGAGLPPVIKPGMRAMSVKVNEVIGVAGFVVPGSRVDVLVTIRQEKDSMTRAVVSNVEVLTAGTKYDQGEAKKDTKPIPTTVVTLMVDPSDAERIALAAAEGQIMLALRNPLDTQATATAGVRTGSLMAAATTETRAPRPVVRRPVRSDPVVASHVDPPPAPRVVITYKASKRGEEVLQ